ncbi:hypothetical protein OG304_36825 [Streptomyces sp. NBC_00160]|nr:hypothetical protein [Streptomyces sp. NBC_00160]MCX5308948.1 hypothetical protein [Streptomyces sp. NBC_00160]
MPEPDSASVTATFGTGVPAVVVTFTATVTFVPAVVVFTDGVIWRV